ncbi:MAG: hypothetical protein H7Z38_02915 [Rubrivivax sp.]|nr:hypothetical protein [Pyrinomonadaceae bacterium]
MTRSINWELTNGDGETSSAETFPPDFETLKAEVMKGIALALKVNATDSASVPDLDEKRGVDFYEEVTKFEVELIRQALAHTGGNQRAAARLLGMKTTTLYTKVKSYKLDIDSVAA